eukprot:gene13753-18445_t
MATFSVEEAVQKVLQYTKPLPIISIQLNKSLHYTLAEDIVATHDFPEFPISIMDGYAVKAPMAPGRYIVKEDILAGTVPNQAIEVEKGVVSYITTGGMMPKWANAVVKVEDTEQDNANKDCKYVKIKVNATPGMHVREIGSDIAKNQLVLAKGHIIAPAEIGLLATIGQPEIKCYQRPIIGVMSTGSELIEPWETPTGSQIRDTNRIAIIAALKEDNFEVIDFGIAVDDKDHIRNRLLTASHTCDVVITSGGVSMGAADFVKPLLNELGTIHFGRLNMKPGKPTTFATVPHTDGSGKVTLFFGLPGNPVSCLVTKSLFVDPSLKRLQGLTSESCLHPQLLVKTCNSDIILDPERPEYHRAYLHVNSETGVVYAESTGNQRSSRLLSMKSANALLFLPQGPGVIKAGTDVVALLTRSLPSANYKQSVHYSAASLDFISSDNINNNKTGFQYQSFSTLISNPSQKITELSASISISNDNSKGFGWKTISVGLLTISDRASQGVYKDESGPIMGKLLEEMSTDGNYPLIFTISRTALVPDEPELIKETVLQWTDPNNSTRVDFVLTSGGTGFGLRDQTPEAIKPLFHREAPGIAQSLLNEGLKHTPLAVMSRPVVGTRFKTFIVTLPGSVKAIKENIVCLKVLLPRVFELLKE